MLEENQKFAFMVDVSGSTGGSDNYWTTVKQIQQKYASQIGFYYQWDSQIQSVTREQMLKQIQSKEGKGGTSPQAVAQEILKKNFKKVILITDGQVSDLSVNQCDKCFQNYEFTKTICFIIASSRYGVLNMSVTCPFTRRCDNEVYQKNQGKQMKKLVQYTPEDYKILDTLDQITLENFEANYDKIQGLIIALNMGKQGNIPLKDQLVVMKNRLMKQLSKQKSDKNVNSQMRKNLQKGNLKETLQLAEQITKAYFADNRTLSVQQKIAHLIGLCGDLRGKYNLDQIKSNKMPRAQDAKQAKLDPSIGAQQISKHLIQCPIIMDEDVPQILVDEGQPILAGIEKSILSDITSCPLRILNYPKIKAKLKSRLSNFIGVKYTDKFLKNPFTQKRLCGSIPLGCHITHTNLGNYTIAKMFSDGKILGNPNMFFAVIWYIIKQKEIEYLKQIQKNAEQHLIFRLKSSKTMASLSGLSQLVNTKISSDIAVWYCVHSGYLNQPLNRDTFRFHLFNMPVLIDIVKILGYPIEQRVEKHYLRTKQFFRMMSAYKNLTATQKNSFKIALRCLHQNSIEINLDNVSKAVQEKETIVRFIPVDGQASKQKVNRILKLFSQDLQKLTVEEILTLGSMIDSQKSSSLVGIDYDFKANPLPKAQVNWLYGVKQQKQFQKQTYQLCPKTLRLSSTDNNKQWEVQVEAKSEIPAKNIFKGKKYFQEFLEKYRKIPTKDELLVFYYNRFIIGKKGSTLPYLAQAWAQKLATEYKRGFEKNNMTIDDALKLLHDSKQKKSRTQVKKQ